MKAITKIALALVALSLAEALILESGILLAAICPVIAIAVLADKDFRRIF